jgi:divalent metal cation (Fe/Co/Zn/Cd) transporter
MVSIFFFPRYGAWKADEVNSPSLLADASHWFWDTASTAIVLFAVLGSWIGYPFIDRIAALLLVVFIAKVGWDIVKNSMRPLMDASVDPGTLQRIREVILTGARTVEEVQQKHLRREIA